MSYNVRNGDRRGTDLDFVDFTYDGMIQDNFLLDGLGQLTDGEIGDSNFRLDQQALGIKGYEWVGWRNDSLDYHGPLQITFKFDHVRNFTSVILNCNNQFSKDIRVFKMALVYFSVGGNLYQNKPVKFNFQRDSYVDLARPVLIPLNHNLGKFVRLQLYFDAKWMMISEIQFSSGQYQYLKFVCFSRLLKCLRSLYGKQCGPRSDCSYRSSLIWVHPVCFYT